MGSGDVASAFFELASEELIKAFIEGKICVLNLFEVNTIEVPKGTIDDGAEEFWKSE